MKEEVELLKRVQSDITDYLNRGSKPNECPPVSCDECIHAVSCSPGCGIDRIRYSMKKWLKYLANKEIDNL